MFNIKTEGLSTAELPPDSVTSLVIVPKKDTAGEKQTDGQPFRRNLQKLGDPDIFI